MSSQNSTWWRSLDDYILGLDLGPSSLGWAIIECDSQGKPGRIVQSGVRRFEAGVLGDIEGGRDESRATERRGARGPRRQHWRRQWRTRKLFSLLTKYGLLPSCEDDSPDTRHNLLIQVDADLRKSLAPEQSRIDAHVFPYQLRATAIQGSLPIYAVGRALYHLAQRRGFLSNRKTAKGDEEEGKVKSGIIHLQEEMKKAECDTLGQFFATLDPEQQRIRARWTSRQMYEDEFERIWSRQAQDHPLLTAELKQAIHGAIFHQRPLKSQKGLIGRCELEPDKRRAPLACLAAQRFRIAQRVNDLRVVAPDGEVRELTTVEREKLSAALQTQAEMSWAAVKELLDMKKSKEYGLHWVFNFEEGGDTRIVGNRTADKLAKVLGDAWHKLSAIDQARLVDEMLSFESEDALAKRLVTGWKLSPQVATESAQLTFEQGNASLSRRALDKLLPLLEQGIAYSTARKQIYGESFTATKALDRLPPVKPTNKARDGAFPELRNPAVERAMSELRKVVNAILSRCGKKPTYIRVELTRDLKHNRQRRKEMTKRRDQNTSARDKAKKRILEELPERYVTTNNILKVRLAEECEWICPFTNKSISMKALVGDHPQFDIEHIIPFSRSLDNSFINKTLCFHEENRNKKRNRTPYEAYHGTPQYDDIIQRVKRFKGELRAKKLSLFQTETLPDQGEFSARLLSDTRYISRLASQYLGLLYGGKLKIDDEGTLRVQVSAGRATAYLRQRWNLNSIIGYDDEKNRDDHRHHAIDAIVIALTDARAVQLLAHAAEEAEDRHDPKLFADVKAPWESFMPEARAAIERINVSSRVSRKLNGALHKDTILSKPRMETDGKGKPVEYHVVRKRLDAMSPQEVEAIVDPRIREIVQDKLQKIGGTPQQAFKDPNQHPYMIAKDGRMIPIHKARIRKSDRPMPVGEGSNRRYVNPGSNHHMEIVAVLDADGNEKKWEGILVSRFEAVQRRRRKEDVIQREHGAGKRFKFSLTGGEYVVMDVKGNEELTRVTVISEGQAEFVLHKDARPITVRKKIPGARIRSSPDAMRKANARKVIIDPLGEIHSARD